EEVERDGERQRERADGVLDHHVRDLERQSVAVGEHGGVVGREPEGLDQLHAPFLDGKLIKRGYSGAAHAGLTPPPDTSSDDIQSRRRLPSTSGVWASADRSRVPVSTMAVRSPRISSSMKATAPS